MPMYFPPVDPNPTLEAEGAVVVSTPGGLAKSPTTNTPLPDPNTAPDGEGRIIVSTASGLARSAQSTPIAPGFELFGEFRNDSGPNAVVPVQAVSAVGAEPSIDFALIPRGAGALLATISDGTATGGNKRGQRAVDWQRSRNFADRVASGTEAVICGGGDNRASGHRSAVLGGAFNLATGANSWVPGGAGADTKLRSGYGAWSSGFFSVSGDAQTGNVVQGAETVDDTPTPLVAGFLGGLTLNNSLAQINEGQAYVVAARVIAVGAGALEVKSWFLEAMVHNPGVLTIVGVPTKVVLAETPGAAAWNVDWVVATSSSTVYLQATGAAATRIRWVARVESVELVGPSS